MNRLLEDPARGSALLEVKGLSKNFGAIAAVRGVDFEVAPGEIFGVIGPNGSGKTTLFNCILGQLRPSAGTVLFEGKPITGASPLALARRGLGRTFQSLQVFGGLSVRDNLIAAAQEFAGSLAGRLFSAPDAGCGARADAMLELVNLTALAGRPAGALSYGQQKLLDIGMAFMAEPRLVFLDEPCAGVNPALVDVLASLLARLNRERGASFVVIEHNMEFVMGLCRRVMVMAEGALLALGEPDTVRADPAVMEAYLGV
jgi:branched-chain amino acid transport system ATP-binding protein